MSTPLLFNPSRPKHVAGYVPMMMMLLLWCKQV